MLKASHPQVTVLMTVFNGENYLKPTVQSILNQTYKNFEFLIIDDCSQDNSFDIIQSFQDERIKIHRNDANIGQTKSLNIGLKLAASPYIARIDADDIAFPQWLQTQLLFIERYPQFAVVSAPSVIIDSKGRAKRLLKSLRLREDIILKALTSTPINHVGSFMQKKTILGEGGYDESFQVAADYELWSRLLKKGFQMTSTTKTLTAIRVHAFSVSKTQKESGAFCEVGLIIEKNFRELAGYPISALEAKRLAQVDYLLENLGTDDLKAIKVLLKTAYQSTESAFSFQRRIAQKKWKELVKTIYVKKVFNSIQNNDLQKARSVARYYVAEEGIWNFPFLLLLSSYAGKFFMKRIVCIYEKFSLFLATVKLCRHKFFLPSLVS